MKRVRATQDRRNKVAASKVNGVLERKVDDCVELYRVSSLRNRFAKD